MKLKNKKIISISNIYIIISIIFIIFFFKTINILYQKIDVLQNQNKFIVKYLSGGITNLPKNNGPLREKQIQLTKVLIEFDQFAKKHNVEYWLEYGTLIGAVRHKGFIPWDDDLDIGMTEENLNKIKELAKDPKNEISLIRDVSDENHLWFFENKYGKLDIFPYVFIKNENLEQYKKYVKISRWIPVFLRRLLGSVRYVSDQLDKLKENESNIKNNENVYMITRIQSKTNRDGPFYSFFKCKDIFPLKQIEFEGHFFSAPQNSDLRLKGSYGDYMDLPDDFGYSHHINSW